MIRRIARGNGEGGQVSGIGSEGYCSKIVDNPQITAERALDSMLRNAPLVRVDEAVVLVSLTAITLVG